MLAIFILPLIGAALVTVLGMIWYGPLFGKTYRDVMGMVMPIDMAAAKKDMMIRAVLDFLMSFVLLFGFLTIMNLAYAGTYQAALVLAVLFWFFVVMPQKASSAIWSNKNRKASWTLFGIAAGHSLVSFLIVAPLFILLIKLIA